ncbi:MAG: HAMP domain-containing histidine kinase [Bacteroides sp.]|nr:HAMP domain-containing histidine kinase [Bacteroides sp.]
MKYSKFIRWFTFIGLLSIFALQSIWLYNSYSLLKNNIINECNSLLDKAFYKEMNLIAKGLPENYELVSGPRYGEVHSLTYLSDGLIKIGRNYSLASLDSIAKSYFDEDLIICSVNPETKEITDKSDPKKQVRFYAIKSEIIPTKLDLSDGVQLIIYNPFNLIIERIGTLLLSTLIIMLFIIVCLIYQTNLIFILKRILQLREDFTYALIHDMKSPLSTIFMTLNFLHSGRMDGKPEMKEKYFLIAEEESDKLLKLTNKVLTISKLEKQKMEMRLSCVALAPMLERLIEKFKAKSEKPLHFALDLKVPTVAADEEYLEEVFRNLIDNAVKYSGEEVKITISSESNDTYTIIRVHDNGMGIARKHLPYVFNKFERGAASKRIRKGGAAGFGLGLSFVQQVIEAHQGNVFANSIENEFTEISIFLPNTTEVL